MKRIKWLIFMTVVIVQYSTEVTAQTLFDTLSDRNWIGTGKLMGSSAEFKLEWRKILGGEFYELNFENVRFQMDGKVVFKAVGVYRIVDKSIKGNWFDSRGVTFPLIGWIDRNTIIINWGSEETEKGKTIYELTDSATLIVKDYLVKESQELQFGFATYTSQ